MNTVLQTIKTLPDDNQLSPTPFSWIIPIQWMITVMGFFFGVAGVTYFINAFFVDGRGIVNSDQAQTSILLLIGFCLALLLFIRARQYKHKHTEAVNSILNSGYLLNSDSHGITYKVSTFQMYIDCHKGLVLINSLFPDDALLNKRTLVIEFEQINNISVVGTNTLQMTFLLNSVNIPQFSLPILRSAMPKIQRVINAFDNQHPELIKRARGNDYPEIRAEIQKKGWLVE